MIGQKWYVMELNCDQIIFNMICRDEWHIVIIAYLPEQ
jgi:lipopolysaccharide biosynthesis glycosyltransferase